MRRSAAAHCNPDAPDNATFLSTAERTRELWARQKADPSLNLIGKRPGRKHLDQDQRREVHALYWTRQATQKELAERYGVSRPTIAGIVHDLACQPQPAEPAPMAEDGAE